MAISVDLLSSHLKNIQNSLDLSALEKSVSEAARNYAASKSTTLGTRAGEVKGGIESLVAEADTLDSAQPAIIAPVVSRITRDVQAPAEKVMGRVSSGVASKIEAVVGAEAALDGFLHAVISAGSPEAIAASLKTAARVEVAELEGTLRAVASQALSSAVGAALGALPWKNFLTTLGSVRTRISQLVAAASALPVLDLGEKVSRNFENQVLSLVSRAPASLDLKAAFAAVTGKNYAGAYSVLKRYVNLPEGFETTVASVKPELWSAEVKLAQAKLDTLFSSLKTISPELTSYVTLSGGGLGELGTSTISVKTLGDPVSPSFKGARGSSRTGDTWDFSDVASEEELDGMFRGIVRGKGAEVAGMTLHWSGTFLDQDVDASWINTSHRDLGLDGIGYHLVVRRDGTLQRGRPLDQPGQHDEANDATFLGVCLVGGLNVTRKNATRPFRNYESASSITRAQFNTLDSVMRSFFRAFPSGQVAGHYMTSATPVADPGFDVPTYCRKFKAENVFEEDDPVWKAGGITVEKVASVST